MAGFDLSILSSLLPMAGAGASGFMEGQQQAIAANQAKQAMYLAEQEERRKQQLFPKTIRNLDQAARAADQDFEFAEKMNPYELERAGLPVRPNESGLNADVVKALGLKPEQAGMVSRTTLPEQLGILGDAATRQAGITKAQTPRPSNDPHKRLNHLERLRNQARTRPPKNLNEVIPLMDDEMKLAMRNEAWKDTQAYLGYLDREIEAERSRLGMGANPSGAGATTMESILEKYKDALPQMAPRK